MAQLQVPSGPMWTTYDEEADDSELLEDGVLVRYAQGEVVGITVPNASRRAGSAKAG